MILDELNEFADDVEVDQSGADVKLLGDQIPLGSIGRDVGNGEPMYLVVQVTEAFDSTGGAATVAFVLASDAAAAIADDGTATEHVRSPFFPELTLALGFTWVVALPMEGEAYEAFLGILTEVTDEALTAGKVNAFLTHDVARWKAYADGPEAINPGA